MFKLSATFRIALSLTGLATSVFLLASMIGFFPDRRKSELAGRQHLCEAIAITFSTMADEVDEESFSRSLTAIAERNPDVQSIGIRKSDGTLLVEVNDHRAHWTDAETESTDTELCVPVHSANGLWGSIEMRFDPIQEPALTSLVMSPEITMAVFCGLALLGVYYAYLRQVLRQLNPSKVVPARVRDALNSLAEGLLVLDAKQNVVLANRSFEQATGLEPNSLVGRKADTLPLFDRADSQRSPYPWQQTIENGDPITGRILGFLGDQANRTFSVSAAPIMDEAGRNRGAIASFEDVTPLENKNRELSTMVDHLRESSDAIRRQNRELEHLATRDPLTGCLNRRAFFEQFESVWASSTRYSTPLSLCMVDVDHFKSVNDEHGHSVGDEVLRKLATTLQGTARDADVVCRYGGEEFVVLMPHTSLEDAARAAERFRIAVSQLEFEGLAVTASFGVSALSENPGDPQELLDQADKTLYVAKRSGRNRVMSWDVASQQTEMLSDTSVVTEVEKSFESRSVPFNAVTALTSALAYRDQATAGHSRRVADLCVATAEGLMSYLDCYSLEIAALLHDIGKIGVPDTILLKPGRLTDEEWQVVQRYETIGVEIVRAAFASEDLTSIIANYKAHFGDSTMRPWLPTGRDIPVGARILAICDAFDSMVTPQAYRQSLTQDEAFRELRRCGTQFDPELVEHFIASVEYRVGESTDRSVRVSHETALDVGLQMERLSALLDEEDIDGIHAVANHLHATASKHGATDLAEIAGTLEELAKSHAELYSIMESASDLLDECRNTQDVLCSTLPTPTRKRMTSPSNVV